MEFRGIKTQAVGIYLSSINIQKGQLLAMNQTDYIFHLEVQQIDKYCLFKLSWGQGQQLNETIPFPETLSADYQQWSANYLNFYKTALRGRVAAKGNIAPPTVDWHAKLVESEAKLLYEFHQWLRAAELYDIRSVLEQAVIDQERKGTALPVDLFLTCNPLDLERLPWEAWEIGRKFAATGRIKIVRKPLNIQKPTVKPQKRDGKARILAILGDDTGLNFKIEREALESLSQIAEVEFVGWQLGKDIELLKKEIVNSIQDERGWDLLFFAGHSNETALMGGELAIAPGKSLFLQELAPSLTIAKEKGLQFALFNSCKGLSLANGLINLGLSQVAVMREPIHNQVAQVFLVRFLERMAEYKDQCKTEYIDAQEALLSACQYLKLEKHLTYPSAYLIPSLFRHPDALPFRFKPFGFRHKVKRWLPKKKEAIALGALALISWQIPIQSFLLEQRVLVQAVYRQFTNQIPVMKQPPVLLVAIDEESVKKAKISDPKPLDRTYLADLINKLSAMNAKVIGLDYLLDRHQKENDPKLAKAIRAAVQKQGTWFVFASRPQDPAGWFDVLPEIAHPNWSFRGDMRGIGEHPVHMRIQPLQDSPSHRPTLSYLMALAHQLNVEKSDNPPLPQLQSSQDLLSQVKTYVTDRTGKDYKTVFSPKDQLSPITKWSYLLKQMWLQPIFDFSIPPEQAYQRIPAWQLLETPATNSHQQPPIALIAPGGYGEAGVLGDGKDNLPLPSAVWYWRSHANPPDGREIFPGGEAHAYMIHHFLNRRIVTPIPDIWLMVILALLGKGIALALEQENEEKPQEKEQLFLFLFPEKQGKLVVLLASATAIYALASLQLYISAAIVLPLVLPTATIWSFVLLALSGRKFPRKFR